MQYLFASTKLKSSSIIPNCSKNYKKKSGNKQQMKTTKMSKIKKWNRGKSIW